MNFNFDSKKILKSQKNFLPKTNIYDSQNLNEGFNFLFLTFLERHRNKIRFFFDFSKVFLKFSSNFFLP